MNAELAVEDFIEKRLRMDSFPELAIGLSMIADKVFTVINWPFSVYSDCRAFIRNIKNRSHVLRTQHVKFGEYSDLPEMIPDAMLTAVIDFVEQECAHMTVWCWKSDPSVKNMTPAELGIMWLTRDEEDDEYGWRKEVLDIYHYAKNEWRKRDASAESGATAFWDKTEFTLGKLNSPEYREEWGPIAKRLTEIEAEIDAKETEMLLRLVKIRKHLWT